MPNIIDPEFHTLTWTGIGLIYFVGYVVFWIMMSYRIPPDTTDRQFDVWVLPFLWPLVIGLLPFHYSFIALQKFSEWLGSFHR